MTSFESLDRLRHRTNAPPAQLFDEAVSAHRHQSHKDSEETPQIELSLSPDTDTRCQLAQSQKMEAISRVTGGIAHNFNNLLTAIVGYCHLLEDDSRGPEKAGSYRASLMASADRATDLVKQLLAFSQQQILEAGRVDLNRVVNGHEPLLRRLAGYQIEIDIDLEPDLGSVRVDRKQLKRVLSNLTTNAVEAMPTGGRLSVRTRRLELEAFSVSNLGIAKGNYIVLEIEDTGPGIDEAIYNRIFEPFFSTKEELNGTGLGLSVVYGIVKQSGGQIRVESCSEKGTLFRIYLPEADPKKNSITEPTSASGTPTAGEPTTDSGDQTTLAEGRRTILLAEDEPKVRQALTTFLTRQGYQVLAARDGTEGLEIAERHHGEIDLLLTDIVMPRMDGLELAQTLHAERADTKVLFISGYMHEREILADLVRGTDVEFLEKPFLNECLEMKLRAMLGTPPRRSSPRAA